MSTHGSAQGLTHNKKLTHNNNKKKTHEQKLRILLSSVAYFAFLPIHEWISVLTLSLLVHNPSKTNLLELVILKGPGES